MSKELAASFSEELSVLDSQALRRRLKVIDSLDGALVFSGERRYVCWCSNDYLGLSQHPRCIQAMNAAAAKWGVGSRASRLLAGTSREHKRLEESLARWFGAEDALVFASGYLANLGILSSLLSQDDFVVADKLIHASLWDALRASGAKLRVFRHNDAAHAGELLKRSGKARRRWIVAEGVFSMEGDKAPLKLLARAAQDHGAQLYLDDAHGAFVLGRTGRGSPEEAGVPIGQLVYMGTLGKALGCQGGFVVGSGEFIEWLHNKARTFIYSTALAAPVAAAAAEALHVIDEEPLWSQTLLRNTKLLHQGLIAESIPTARAASHILPVFIGDSGRALKVGDFLWKKGQWCPAIRPPTVPKKEARLRISLSALHTPAQTEQLVSALSEAFREDGLKHAP